MSNFSVTCRMLSQYLKESRSSFGGLGLEMAPRTSLIDNEVTVRAPAKTMSLFPGVDVLQEADYNAGDVVGADCRVPEAMDLFPQHTGFGSPVVLAKEESANSPETKDSDTTKGQLTILYSGRVLVWDDFPAGKARDLMQRAIKENTPSCHGEHAPPGPIPAPPSASASDMPIARRNSLHRFLEKRKDRISTKAPYQMIRPELSKF